MDTSSTYAEIFAGTEVPKRYQSPDDFFLEEVTYNKYSENGEKEAAVTQWFAIPRQIFIDGDDQYQLFQEGHVIAKSAYIADGEQAEIAAGTIIGPNAIVANEVVIGAFSHIRSGTRIEAHAEIGSLVDIGEHSSIGAKSIIEDSVTVDDSVVVERKVTIGSISRLKQYTKVEEGASLGRAVTVGEGVKIRTGAQIGNDCELDDWVYIQPHHRVNSHTRVVYSGRKLENSGKKSHVRHFFARLLEL